jgi:hypothetical protein
MSARRRCQRLRSGGGSSGPPRPCQAPAVNKEGAPRRLHGGGQLLPSRTRFTRSAAASRGDSMAAAMVPTTMQSQTTFFLSVKQYHPGNALL